MSGVHSASSSKAELAARKKRRMELAVAADLCVVDGCNESAWEGRKKCRRHVEMQRAANRRHKERHKEKADQEKLAKEKAGICNAGKCDRPAAPGKKRCKKHLKMARAHSRQWAKANRENIRAYAAEYRKTRREQGLCKACKAKALPGKQYCARHQDDASRRSYEGWQRWCNLVSMHLSIRPYYYLVDEADDDLEYGPYETRMEAIADKVFRKIEFGFIQAR